MNIYFGLEIDEKAYPTHFNTQTLEDAPFLLGKRNMLLLLETFLGEKGYEENNNYLRIEQFRQVIHAHLINNPDAFFQASFEADPLATAATLLDMRDELLLADWDFIVTEKTPPRLASIANLHQMASPLLEKGAAERWQVVFEKIETSPLPFEQIFLQEPLDLLPLHFKKLFHLFSQKGIAIHQLSPTNIELETDLGTLQNSLQNAEISKQKLRADGSIFILQAKHETTLATMLAQLFDDNPTYKPLCIIPEKNRGLEIALLRQGLPSLGILSASLGRPTLQILKLAPTFLWEPIDPYKIMEFVSLPIKPLPYELGDRIANEMAKTPGTHSDRWFAMMYDYFESLQENANNDGRIDIAEIKNQYDFWFNRRRYPVNGQAPKREAIEIFHYIQHWSADYYDKSSNKDSSLLVLSEQARRIKELLEISNTAEQTNITFLELERTVRTIYEPAPIIFKEAQVGHLDYVYHPSALLQASEQTIWWNFSEKESTHFFSLWYQTERDFLAAKGISLTTPSEQNALQLWQQRQAILQTKRQLILCVPEKIDGKNAEPHPLLSSLKALFGNLSSITFDIEREAGREQFLAQFVLSDKVSINPRHLGTPPLFLHTKNARQLSQRNQETYTSLDSLFYYPYQWVFRHKLKLNSSSILSIVKDNTLKGNLAHRFFELIFKEKQATWTQSDIEKWIDKHAYPLFAKEGAVLLMYGREPERANFIRTMKVAAWSLLSMLQENQWQVVQTEMDLQGTFLDIPIKGKADLVLRRGAEFAIVDLKWSNARKRREMLKNQEDLQLVLYSRLLSPPPNWAHTAFFIIEDGGKMIARNNLAFKEAIAIDPHSDHREIHQRIWEKMEATFKWRMAQMVEGKIEVRTAQTYQELDELYADDLMDVLEMRDTNAPFDDYRTLINLLE